MNLKTQSGRSMVEMLGTLAIIGVLSIGGIAGYSYGMDKYRCNQTMRDISLRTVDLITQASQGRTTLSLSEWENEDSIYDFSNPAYSDDGLVMFDIGTTKKLPKSVCQMVFEGLSNTAVQIDINGSVATSKDSCSDNNTMTFYFEGGGATTDTGATGEQCDGTICGMCEICDYIGYSSDPDYGKKKCVTADDYEMKCITDGQLGWCIDGICEPITTTCNCDPNQYCSDTNEDNCSPHPSGTCVEAKSKFKEKVINGITYYISNETMSWWDAISACEALGNKKLLTVYDLVSDWDNTGPVSTTHYSKSPLGNALYNLIWNNSGNPGVWTSSLDGACYAYNVYLGDVWIMNDWIDHKGNRTYARYVICK